VAVVLTRPDAGQQRARAAQGRPPQPAMPASPPGRPCAPHGAARPGAASRCPSSLARTGAAGPPAAAAAAAASPPVTSQQPADARKGSASPPGESEPSACGLGGAEAARQGLVMSARERRPAGSLYPLTVVQAHRQAPVQLRPPRPVHLFEKTRLPGMRAHIVPCTLTRAECCAPGRTTYHMMVGPKPVPVVAEPRTAPLPSTSRY